MYYIGKGLQFVGLTIIGLGFISHFPNLMDYKFIGVGLIFFFMGWIVRKFGLNNF